MTQIVEPRATAPNVAATPPDEHVLWYHAALCQLALPIGVPEGNWHRNVRMAAVTITVGPDGTGAPNGSLLRLLVMYICDTAVRSGVPAINLGQSTAALASEIGVGTDQITLDEISNQLACLVSMKVMVSLNGGPDLALLDARSKPRTTTKDWRSSLRLNARFHANLTENAIPLDRRIIEKLRDSPTALDAYAWIRYALTHVTVGQIASATWQDLQDRFGEAEQDSSAFRSAFEEALRRVFSADLSIAIAVNDEGVSIRLADAEDADATPHPTPQDDRTTAPVQTPGPEPRNLPVRPSSAAPHAGQQTEREVAPEPQTCRVVSHAAALTPARAPLGPVSLRPHLTGLIQVIWLRQSNGDRDIVVGITPDASFHPDRLTVLALEPIIMQAVGGIPEREFERVSAWVMANRDLIDDVWEGNIDSLEGVYRRVRKVPAVGWR